MDYRTYRDKVYGGWLGKCLGGAAGAPVEGIKAVIKNQHYSELFQPDLPNDDLDLQLLWLEVLQKKGFGLTAMDMAAAWDAQCWYPFSEYGIFLKNYERGIYPPVSGVFNNPLFCEGEGSPIRSEIWGMIFPERPGLAAKYAEMDSSLDHAGASMWIEQYYAAVEAMAFAETDMEKLLQSQLGYLPEGSRPRECMESIFRFYEEDPADYLKARTKLMRKYGHHEFTNSVANLGIVGIALLYGEGDMDRTVNIAFRCGYDADCTCATAGAILGIVLGADNIPAGLKDLVKDQFVIGIDVKRKDNTINTLTEETCALGILAKEQGGLEITEVPDGLEYPRWEPGENKIEMAVAYDGQPAVGIGETCAFRIRIVNHTEQVQDGMLALSGIPEEFRIENPAVPVRVKPSETAELSFAVTVPEEVKRLSDTNIMTASFCGEELRFGVAGASVWRAAGPFFEAMDRPAPPDMPSPHGDNSTLPSLECMVNNEVFLEKEYLDESCLKSSMGKEDTVVINASTDMLPMDESFTFKGQGCIYLEQKIYVKEKCRIWAVIGNNDGFCLWVNGDNVLEKDEIRLWTPYNNCCLVDLNEGENTVHLKLLRRTESLKFSIGLRNYGGQHWHTRRWYVGYTTGI